MAPELDELSRTIGAIEARLKNIELGLETSWKKLEKIEETLTAHKLTVAGIAGAMAVIVYGISHAVKTWLRW